jgi:hypothetical protein
MDTVSKFDIQCWASKRLFPSTGSWSSSVFVSFIVMFSCPESWMRSLEVSSGCVESDPSSRHLTNKYLIMKVRKEVYLMKTVFLNFLSNWTKKNNFRTIEKDIHVDRISFVRKVFILFPPFSTCLNTNDPKQCRRLCLSSSKNI